MEEQGMSIREDAMGNIFGRWAGTDDTAGSCLEENMHMHEKNGIIEKIVNPENIQWLPIAPLT